MLFIRGEIKRYAHVLIFTQPSFHTAGGAERLNDFNALFLHLFNRFGQVSGLRLRGGAHQQR